MAHQRIETVTDYTKFMRGVCEFILQSGFRHCCTW